MDRIEQIQFFQKKIKVSRETLNILLKFEELLKKSNKSLNLIGNSTINNIWIRHFTDSAQLIDLIDKNDSILIDVGTGAGLPGIVLSILLKDRTQALDIKLIEKSKKKASFLKDVIRKLNLKAQVMNINLLDHEPYLVGDIITARAFKPLDIFLSVLQKKVKKYKKIIIFLGKTGKNQIEEASKTWDIKYNQRVSITNNDSLILEINNFKKK